MSIAASNPARPAQRSAGVSAAAPRAAARATVAAPVASIRPATSAPMFAHLLGADTEDEILHLQLSDLPRMSTGLHVEGFKHTLLSRIFGLFTR